MIFFERSQEIHLERRRLRYSYYQNHTSINYLPRQTKEEDRRKTRQRPETTHAVGFSEVDASTIERDETASARRIAECVVEVGEIID